MTQEELNERIKKHETWLRIMSWGERLVIGADDNVKGLNFSWTDLRDAIFEGADLSFARFSGTSLQHANFDNAILNHTNFNHAIIEYDEDLILKFAESIKESRKEKSPSDTSAQAASAEADKKGQ